MNVELNRLVHHLGRKLLCVTHSDRPMDAPRCDINYLERRYASPIRLPPLEPFETLAPSSASSPYRGTVTLYDIGESGERRPELVCAFRPESYKPQHAIWHRGMLWVLGTEHIEIYDPHLTSLKVIRDPWLAGTHTIVPDGRGNILVSCAASDGILRFDEASGHLSQVWRVPEDVYGHNYALDRAHSVVDHYVNTDLQLTHINCAWPWRGGMLVSLLIPGAIAWTDGNGGYRELVRGFVGCHGARVRNDIEEVYFADSCSGMLVFLDRQGHVVRRVGTGSRWLHDGVQICGDLFAVAPFDHNEVVLIDVTTRKVVGRIPCGARGGAQLLSFGGADVAAEASADGQAEMRTMELTSEHATRSEPDAARMRRQHAAAIADRDEMVQDYSARLRTKDAIIAELQEARSREVTARDLTIAEMADVRTQEVGLRDRLLAELEAARVRDVDLRDRLLAELKEIQAREIAARDTTIAELAATRARDVELRDTMLADLNAHFAGEVQRRDLMLAELDRVRALEAAARDATIAELSAEQAREVGTRDAMLVDLAAAHANDIAGRDAAVAALRAAHANDVAALRAAHAQALESCHAIVGELRRDLAFATRGWRRWMVGQRKQA